MNRTRPGHKAGNVLKQIVTRLDSKSGHMKLTLPSSGKRMVCLPFLVTIRSFSKERRDQVRQRIILELVTQKLILPSSSEMAIGLSLPWGNFWIISVDCLKELRHQI